MEPIMEHAQMTPMTQQEKLARKFQEVAQTIGKPFIIPGIHITIPYMLRSEPSEAEREAILHSAKRAFNTTETERKDTELGTHYTLTNKRERNSVELTFSDSDAMPVESHALRSRRWIVLLKLRSSAEPTLNSLPLRFTVEI